MAGSRTLFPKHIFSSAYVQTPLSLTWGKQSRKLAPSFLWATDTYYYHTHKFSKLFQCHSHNCSHLVTLLWQDCSQLKLEKLCKAAMVSPHLHQSRVVIIIFVFKTLPKCSKTRPNYCNARQHTNIPCPKELTWQEHKHRKITNKD